MPEKQYQLAACAHSGGRWWAVSEGVRHALMSEAGGQTADGPYTLVWYLGTKSYILAISPSDISPSDIFLPSLTWGGGGEEERF